MGVGGRGRHAYVTEVLRIQSEPRSVPPRFKIVPSRKSKSGVLFKRAIGPVSFGVHISLKTVWFLFVAVVARMAKLLHASAIFVSPQHVQGNLMP